MHDVTAPGTRLLEVGVVEEEVDRLATELEERGLERGRRRLHDPAAGGGRAREGHHVDVGRRGDDLTHQVVAAADDVDDPRWDLGLFGEEPGDACGVERRVRAPA